MFESSNVPATDSTRLPESVLAKGRGPFFILSISFERREIGDETLKERSCANAESLLKRSSIHQCYRRVSWTRDILSMSSYS